MHGGSEPMLDLNGFVLDPTHRELRDASGARVALRVQTMAVLQCLARSVGHVVDKDELMRAVWPEVIVTDDSLVQCIKELRRALHDDEHRIIETEAKRGYRLVTQPAHADAPSVASARARNAGFEQDIRFATSADGTRIAYAVSGDAPVVLVRATHWMTHLEWDWRNAVYGPWVQALSQRYRLVRYDGRGWGLSDRGSVGSLDDWVHDLEAVVDAAGLERFALFGRSQGGAIAIRYVARHPERVTHLVLEGAYARGALRRGDRSVPEPELSALCNLLEVGWGRDNAAFRQLITSMMFPGASTEQMQAFNEIQRVACSGAEAARIQQAMAEVDATADLDAVRCPTLVLHSQHDSRVPFDEGRLMASSIRGARLEPIDSRNHTPLPGEPAFDQVNRLIDAFVLGGPCAAERHARADPRRVNGG
jgi:pimeloyl-ACP methyl ester carboxylesterase